MDERTLRARMLLGEEAMEKLKNSHVAVFGIGGVGSWCAEALCRAGIGELTLIDRDTVSESNRNRQLCALGSTLGQPKAEVMAARLLDINPDCRVHAVLGHYEAADRDRFFADYDYVVDAIDTVKGKLALVEQANASGTPIICAMGAGNKLDPTAFRVADIYQTSICPLARVMRMECRKRGIKKLKVVYSKETPVRPLGKVPEEERKGSVRRDIPGSTAFVPAAAGLIIAGEVVKDLIANA